MGFQVSPGIEFTEKDFSLKTPGVNTSIGGIVGQYSWGPVDKIISISNENDLAKAFGNPNDENYISFFVAADFLSKSDHLKVVRVIGKDTMNSTVGGIGKDLTLNISVLNGQVQSVTIDNKGSGYVVGDLIEIVNASESSSLALLRINDISNSNGSVDGIELLTNGVGYSTASSVETKVTNNIQIKNYEDYENTPNLPEVMGRYPGSLGNSLLFSIVRASEFDNWKWKSRFITPPNSKVIKFGGVKGVNSFSIDDNSISEDSVITVNGITIDNGSDPGKFEATSSQLIFNVETEDFLGNGSGNTFSLLNEFGISTKGSTIVKVGGVIKEEYVGVGNTPFGLYSVDGNDIEFGHHIFEKSGDGSTNTFTIVGVNDITAPELGLKCLVDGISRTVVDTEPEAGEVMVTNNETNVDIKFNSSEVPGIGSRNIRVEWGFIETGVEINIKYGYPPIGDGNIKIFSDQDECHAITIDQDGEITGEEGVILERFDFLSLKEGKLSYNGEIQYYFDAINRRSKFIRIGSKISDFGDKVLTGGSDNYLTENNNEKIAEISKGWDLFNNSEYVEVSHLIGSDGTAEIVIHIISKLAEYRRDCVGYFSPLKNSVLNNRLFEKQHILDYRDLLPSTSYGHFDSGWKYIVDTYNGGKFRWIPSNGESAGLYARTHIREFPWINAAGFNRGKMNNTLKLAYSPSKPDRDELYPAGINPIVHFPNEGSAVLYGDRTMLTKPSNFDRMDIRFLFIYLEKVIVKSSKYLLFEKNTELTRNRFLTLVNPILRRVQGREGIEDFIAVCDERNNPPTVVENKEFVGDIFIKPTHSINFMQLNFINVASSASFNEIINAVLPEIS